MAAAAVADGEPDLGPEPHGTQGHEEENRHGQEEEEPTCRVCHMEAEPDAGRPLFHPCWCKGSIKHVHQDCLLRWLEASRNSERRCELCGAAFAFTPVYASGAPPRLSLPEVLVGLAQKGLGQAPIALRGGLLVLLWLGLLPLLTSLTFQAYFLPELSPASLSAMLRLRLVEGGPRRVGLSVLGGLALTVFIIVTSLTALGVRDALVAAAAARGQEAGALQEDDEEDEEVDEDDEDEDEEENVDDAAPAPPAPEAPAQPPQPQAAPPVAQQQQQPPQQLPPQRPREGPVNGWEIVGLRAPLQVALRRWARMLVYNLLFLTLFQLVPHRVGRVTWGLLLRMDDAKNGGLAGRFAGSSSSSGGGGSGGPFVAFLRAVQRRVLVPAAELLRGRGLGQEGGEQGSPPRSVAGALLAQAEALVEDLFFPPEGDGEEGGAAGALLQRQRPRPRRGRLAEAFAQLLAPAPAGGGKNATAADAGAISGRAAVAVAAARGMAALVDELAVLGLGYSVLLCILGSLALAYAVTHAIHRPRRAWRMAGRVGRGLRRGLLWAKVGFLFVVDLLVIPQMLGWAIDVCTTDVFGTTISDRVRFLLDWPLVAVSAHWLGGFAFMALCGLLATELRRVLHPDVLRGILPQPGEWGGAADGDFGMPNNNNGGVGGNGVGGGGGGAAMLQLPPAQEENVAGILAHRPLKEHFRRVLLAFLLYLPSLLLLVRLPARWGHRLLLLSEPLRLRLLPTLPAAGARPPPGQKHIPAPPVYVEIQLPFELFLSHIALPLMLERFRLRGLIRWGLERVFAPLCHALGLGDAMLDLDTLEEAERARRRHRHRGGPPRPPQPLVIRPEPPVPAAAAAEGAEGGAADAAGGGGGQADEAGGSKAVGGASYALRLAALVALSGLGLVLAASVLIQLPVRAGRLLLSRLALFADNDFYAVAVGLLPLPLLVAGLQAAQPHLERVFNPPPPAAVPLPPVPPAAAAAVAAAPAAEGNAAAAGDRPLEEVQLPQQEQQQQQEGAPPAAAVAAAAAAAQPQPQAQQQQLQQQRATAAAASLLGRRVGPYIRKTGEVAVLLVLWLGVAPLLLGLLFELAVILPGAVPLDEAPVLPMYEAWALGLVFLKVWVRCCLLGMFGADYPWRRRFDRLRQQGLRRLDFDFALREVVWPVLSLLLTLLLAPYCLAATAEALAVWYLRATEGAAARTALGVGVGMGLGRGAGPRRGPGKLLGAVMDRLLAAMGKAPPGAATPAAVAVALRRHRVMLAVAALKRHAYMALLLLYGLLLGMRWLRGAFQRLHDSLRDERYLVGIQLRNREEATTVGARAAGETS